jgi:chromosome segregation ATPase
VSTLTKVLVVLLTLSAIFLCGIVVTYAASATNYKAKHDEAVAESKTLMADSATRQAQLNEAIKAKQDEAASLQQQVNKLLTENSNLQSETLTAKAARDELQERVNGWTGTIQKNNQIVADLQQQLAATRGELDKLRDELVTDRGQLGQVRAALEEKTLQLKSMERENARLVEDKTALENKIAGRSATPTAAAASVRPAPNANPSAVMEGRVKEVRTDGNLVSVNIGAANGVKTGDVLHVIRGDQFICDISITNVDTDTSVGTITMARTGAGPQAGDVVTNKL